MYREIPNKPPPPYTLPVVASSVRTTINIIPTIEDIVEIAKYSSKILNKAYQSNNLSNIYLSTNTFGLISKNIPNEKYKFVFDICIEISKEHYRQFVIEKRPSWMRVGNRPQLIITKPFNAIVLEKHICKKLKQIFGYEKTSREENAIMKWNRKKKDHVDGVLISDCQAEEHQWITYDKDKLIVLNQITNDIMNSLIEETVDIFSTLQYNYKQCSM